MYLARSSAVLRAAGAQKGRGLKGPSADKRDEEVYYELSCSDSGVGFICIEPADGPGCYTVSQKTEDGAD